ncbi:hypothetical protein ACFCXA_22200 [Streptomyces virginiae]|uniref:hypothetical protein n=1 Tax=Streptomyces virginiae TaxID=1961 RepID=UPI0035DBAA06
MRPLRPQPPLAALVDGQLLGNRGHVDELPAVQRDATTLARWKPKARYHPWTVPRRPSVCAFGPAAMRRP